MHRGHTYAGPRAACRAGLATLGMDESKDLSAHDGAMSEYFLDAV